ncbi:MAG: tyrosine--tRNA ligase [Elusimicrobia bacterium GWF2_52_66]|nr:MAG: tyrosine--tRNA ligase [Elusimicrobia bacterium GWA2_51_34]OGR87808.1 MAG: tyrosine--tRNA ligase [Elusimicrobia bacterium GWF2_52_66]HAF94715.1 tyrosine--tRNA ligase [Elusimicrobiota bacterium]HCE97720.1 tyrosine--tRNA ligase [Elusimicrobiota bacterium]
MTNEEILKEIGRGCTDIVSREELAEKLSSGKKLRVKLGVDPTSRDLHLGHSVVLAKLRQFQDLGHTAVLIIGDFTAQVGDPSGRDSTRPVIDQETVEKNAETYTQQAFKVLDKAKTEIRFNGEWLKAFVGDASAGVSGLIGVAKNITVSRLLEREDFKTRMKAAVPISLLEILYPVFQGYDSVAVKADIELGGQDQIFNLLVGRDLQKLHSQCPQVVMTMPLLIGTDGARKMSKSYGNYVALNDQPAEIFGKIMSVSDALMLEYYALLTASDMAEIKKLHPMEAKKRLAALLIEKYHGREEAAAAREQFEKVFSKKELPAEIEVFKVEKPGKLSQLMAACGVCGGTNEARRLIEQGAVRLDGVKAPEDLVFEPRDCVLQVGRRHFRKLIK